MVTIKLKTNWEYVKNLKDEDIDYTDYSEVISGMFKNIKIRYPDDNNSKIISGLPNN